MISDTQSILMYHSVVKVKKNRSLQSSIYLYAVIFAYKK